MVLNNTNQLPDIGKLRTYLISVVSRELELRPPAYADRQETVEQYLHQAFQSTKLQLPNSVRDQLFREIIDDILGYGPLQPLLEDPEGTVFLQPAPAGHPHRRFRLQRVRRRRLR